MFSLWIKRFMFVSVLSLGAPAFAVPVEATISCAGNSCDIVPDSGPVALNPLNFDLQVMWNDQQLELTEPDDDRGEWRVRLLFAVTGTVSDVFETVPVDGLAFVDESGVEVPGISEGYDDVTAFNPTLLINFDIFGPDTQSQFLIHGFNLAPTSLEAIVGTFTSFAFVGANINTSMGSAAITVPEPAHLGGLMLLFGFITLLRRHRAHT